MKSFLHLSKYNKLQSSEEVTTLETVLLTLEKGINNGSSSMIIGTGPKTRRDYHVQFCA